MERKVHRDLKVSRAEVIPELKVFRELRELKVSKAEVILELKVSRDLKVHRDLKVSRAFGDLLVQMDREVDTFISIQIRMLD
jgi:hypothetical protein